MDIAGEQLICLPQSQVWNALNDPQVLKACIPGCESIEQVADNQYTIIMKAVVGPVKARFSGSLTVADVDEPNGYTLSFSGSGGAAGFAKGGARVTLSPEDGATKLEYTASAQVGGKLAQVGARLIDGVARKMSDEFFTSFNALLVPAEGAAKPVADTPAPGALRRHWLIWTLLAAAAIAVALVLAR